MDGLFRPQVADARRRKLALEVRLPRPTHVAAASAIASLTVFALVACAVFGRYTAYRDVPGRLQPMDGDASLVSPRAGVVSEVFLKPGDVVKRGDVVVRIMPVVEGQGNESLSHASAAYANAQKRDAMTQLTSLAQATTLSEQESEAKIRALILQKRQLGTRQSLVRKQWDIAAQTLARLSSLADQAYVSRLQIDQQQTLALGLQAQLAQLDEEAARVDASIKAAQIERSQARVDSRVRRTALGAQLSAAEKAIVEAKAEFSIDVRAPQDGILGSISVQPGQPVTVGQAVASVAGLGNDYFAVFDMPAESAAFVRRGMKLRIKVDAFPYQVYGKLPVVVESVSLTPLGADAAPRANTVSDAASLYRVRARIEPGQAARAPSITDLKGGLLAQLEVPLDRRRLYQWIFAPAAAAEPRRLPDASR